MTRRVVVIANAPVDETYAVDALPRPGESSIGTFLMRDLGGKGANVAIVLGRAGVEATLVAGIGDDERGAFVRERLAAEPLATSLATAPGLPTDLSIVYSTPDGDNAIVTTVAATRSLEPAHAIGVMDTLAAGDLVVLQGNLVREVSLALVAAARSRDLVVALNPSPIVPWLDEAIPRVQIVFANAVEAAALSGGREGEDAVRALLARGPEQVVVTRGAGGALLGVRVRGDGGDDDSPVRDRGGDGGREDDAGKGGRDRGDGIRIATTASAATDIVDTTGAGDTFMAVALASAVRRGTALDRRAIGDAARAAAITVSRRGAASAFPSAAELAELLDPAPADAAS